LSSNLTAIIDADMIRPKLGDFFNSKGKHKTRIDSKKTKECQLWENMSMRAVGRLHPTQVTYRDIFICKEWLDFQNFAEWVVLQPNWDKKGWELDKDILSFGYKLYSPETCVFVPKSLNNFLNDTSSRRTGVHKGVRRSGSGFEVSIIYDGILERKYFADESLCVEEFLSMKKRAINYFIDTYQEMMDRRLVDVLKKRLESERIV